MSKPVLPAPDDESSFERDRNRSADAPHQEAQVFLEDVILKLEEGVFGREYDPEDRNYGTRDGIWRRFVNPDHPEFHTRAWLDAERVDDVSESGDDGREATNRMEYQADDIFYRDIVEQARDALAARRMEELMGAIETLSENAPNIWSEGFGFVSVGALALDSCHSWAGIIDHANGGGDDQVWTDEDLRETILARVHDLSVELCALIADRPRALRHVEWREMERVIGTALSGIGFAVEITPPSKDGGKDIVATCTVNGRDLIFFLEIKHWRSGKKVGDRALIDFVEVNVCNKTKGGLFLSTSGFTEAAYGCVSRIRRHNVRLGAERKVITLCQRFTRRREGLWTPTEELPHILFEGTT